MDAVTAISGTGPAYFFLLTEILASAAREFGLPAETADRLASMTCFGAGAMMASSPGEDAQGGLRTPYPGRTTEAAMEVLEGGNFRDLMFRAADAAKKRSRELAGE